MAVISSAAKAWASSGSRFVMAVVVVVTMMSSVVDQARAQSPTSYYPLQDGVAFVNTTNATSALLGFRYTLSESIQPDQDVLLTLMCSNGFTNSYQARCQAQISNRPDMLAPVMQCIAYWQVTYCRIPSCQITSNSLFIALTYLQPGFRGPLPSMYNISTTLETNTPTKVMSGQPFSVPATLWSSNAVSQTPYCYLSSALVSIDPDDVTTHSTLAFTGPSSVSTAGYGNTVSMQFFFAPATASQGFAYPPNYPSSHGCPTRSEWIIPLTVPQGFVIPPAVFQQAYKSSQNATEWWSMFYFCTSYHVRSEFVVEATVSLTQPQQVASVDVQSSPVQVYLPPSADLFGFAYLQMNAEDTGNSEQVRFLLDYESTIAQGITLLNDSATAGYSGNVFSIGATPNTIYEGAFARSLFDNPQTSASFFVFYSSSSYSPSSEPISFNVSLFAAETPPTLTVASFPSTFTTLLTQYNFSVVYQLQANSTSPPSNVTVCLPEWPVLNAPSTSLSIALSNRSIYSLPSTQNPYNPYCVEIYSVSMFDSNNTLVVTATLASLPTELEKPIPLSFDFNYWQT